MKCKKCEHWVQQKHPVTYWGVCHALPGEKVEFEVEAGYRGGYVKEVSTQEDFYCSYYKEVSYVFKR